MNLLIATKRIASIFPIPIFYNHKVKQGFYNLHIKELDDLWYIQDGWKDFKGMSMIFLFRDNQDKFSKHCLESISQTKKENQIWFDLVCSNDGNFEPLRFFDSYAYSSNINCLSLLAETLLTIWNNDGPVCVDYIDLIRFFQNSGRLWIFKLNKENLSESWFYDKLEPGSITHLLFLTKTKSHNFMPEFDKISYKLHELFPGRKIIGNITFSQNYDEKDDNLVVIFLGRKGILGDI